MNPPDYHSLIPRQTSLNFVPSPPPVQLSQNLKVGSTVQYGRPLKYGVIKWIGKLPGKENELYAGVEMVS